MSNFLIFKAAFNNSATPAIGTYTAEGAAALFNMNASISPDYYLYNTVLYSAVQWFVPTKETTDFEFVADILTTYFNGYFTYFIIADSTGTTRLRMWSLNNFVYFANDDSIAQTGTQYIGRLSNDAIGGFEVFHRFRFRVRKLTASSSSVEVYVDGTLKLTATAGAALVTCAKIGFMGGVNDSLPRGTRTGIQNTYLYDLSGGEVIDRGVLSGAFNRFINWMKSVFALKSDIPTVNDATLTIQKNGVNVQTFTANQSTAATANITVPTAVSELANDSGYLTASSNLDASKLTSGTVDIARLPQGALERLVKVANEAARYALTTADVQLGDTVQQLDTGIMYVVTDADHLDSAAGYTEYTAGTAASVPWSGVTGKPTFAAVATSGAYSDLTGTPALAAVATSGAYSDLTGTPTIPTVNNATLTIQQNGTTVDTFTANSSSDKTVNITVPTATSELTNDSGYITGVAWNDVSNKPTFATVATSGSYNDLSNKPTIPTVNDATLTIQKNGTTVGTFSANQSTNETINISVPTNTSELTNGAGFITADYAIPRSGGAVITGNTFYRNVDDSNLEISGGDSRTHGGVVLLYGTSSSFAPGAVCLVASAGNGNENYMYLYPDGTLTWSGQPIQYGSDQRLKQQIDAIDDKLLDAWEDVELSQFKYNDAVNEKGTKARLHTGYVVQQIQKACESHGVDISNYGLFCHEEYPEETEEVEVTQKDGTKTKERKVIREASEHYSLRYTEALIVECKYLRRCIARLTARIEELEKGKEQEASK